MPTGARRAPARRGLVADRSGDQVPAGSADGEELHRSESPRARSNHTGTGPALAHDTLAVNADPSGMLTISTTWLPVHSRRSITNRGLRRRAAWTHSICSSSSQPMNSCSLSPPGAGVPRWAYAVPREHAEVAPEHVSGESKDTPTRTRARPVPIRRTERAQNFEQATPFCPEQRTELTGRRGRHGHSPTASQQPPVRCSTAPGQRRWSVCCALRSERQVTVHAAATLVGPDQ